ncbi:BRCA1-associated protein [Geodia barretti]|uniref:BRCA1-associated protein n=1 Tax=Geodia barretti TaxID=519541 RepID=A0AA35WWV4_GEOBA|nr:BRCA1-associated protein [Geodia barretti]
MAEETSELSPSLQAKRSTHTPRTATVDTLTIAFEVEGGLDQLPESLRDLVYGEEYGPLMASASEVDAETAKTSLGERTVHSISIETHLPRLDSCEGGGGRTYASATANVSPSSSLRDEKGATTATLRDKIPFFSGIPAVECIKGVMHLFKHRSEPHSSCLVCVLCVPASLHLSDLLTFFSSILSNFESLRVIRDNTPNQYMLLLKFKDEVKAVEFYRLYNGRRYSSLEPTVCQLVYISRVRIDKSSQGAGLAGPCLVELPSCPVCLEKLDDSVLTILCNHSFHTNCLTKWKDSTCPVCRYTQSPDPTGDNTCLSCDSREDLWICLICGNIGCGRYVGRHAHTHFVQTQHTFAMQLGTQRVWDYVGDNYVHRLVHNKEDGKLVEVGGHVAMVGDDEKIDSLQLEYTYLLTSQLESQRLFFEEKLAVVEKEANEELSAMEQRCRSAVTEKNGLEEKLAESERARKASDKKMQQLQQKLEKLSTQLNEEKQMNKCLSDNQRLWKDRVTMLEEKIDITIKQKEKEMRDLREQVRDLMFYLETQKKIAESP